MTMRRLLFSCITLAVLAGAAFAVSFLRPQRIPEVVTERKPVGTWCSLDKLGTGGQTCQLFDASGVRWGTAVPSTGPLLLLVTDERHEDDPAIFIGLMTAVIGLVPLGVTVRSVTLPDAEPGGMQIHTSKRYDIYMDALGAVADQLSVLGIFLADRAKDATFAPQYIDLRTPGRVYYK